MLDMFLFWTCCLTKCKFILFLFFVVSSCILLGPSICKFILLLFTISFSCSLDCSTYFSMTGISPFGIWSSWGPWKCDHDCKDHTVMATRKRTCKETESQQILYLSPKTTKKENVKKQIGNRSYICPKNN